MALLGMRAAHAQATWDVASLEQNVRRMQHQRDGFMPILPYSLPIPSNDDAVTLQQNETRAALALGFRAEGNRAGQLGLALIPRKPADSA